MDKKYIDNLNSYYLNILKIPKVLVASMLLRQHIQNHQNSGETKNRCLEQAMYYSIYTKKTFMSTYPNVHNFLLIYN